MAEYSKQTWVTREVITKKKLDHIEDGIKSLSDDLKAISATNDPIFKYVEDDNTNIWELEGSYVVKNDININIQTGSSIPIKSGSLLSVNTVENDKRYLIIDTQGNILYGTVESDGTAKENGNHYIELSKVITSDNTLEYNVTDDYNPVHKKYLTETIATEIQDLYQGLEKKINEEDPTQTIVNVKDKMGATSTILNVDNIDIEPPIAVIDVLGALKGQDIDERLMELEKLFLGVEIESEIESTSLSSNTYPEITITDENFLNIIKTYSAFVLKIKFTVTGENGNRTFIKSFNAIVNDDTTVASKNKVNNRYLYARSVDEDGLLVYHGSLMGDGETYLNTMTLTATYTPNN